MSEMLSQSVPTQSQREQSVSAPAPQPPLTGMAKWVHEHRDATTKPVGHIGYQMIRNLLAGIPYGIATIGVWSGFEHLTQHADKKIKAATDAGKEAPKFFSGLSKFAKSPAKDIAMIAAGFTLYRGTLKLVRFTKERLFNPNNTEEDTKREVDNFGGNLVKDFKEIAPAEVNSTTYGAIALGLGRRVVAGVEGYPARPKEHVIAAGPLANPGAAQKSVFKTPEGKWEFKKANWKDFSNRVFHSKSMPFAEAAVFIASFCAFFELSDRLYKDVQIRRGIHKENHNSLARVAPEKADIKEQQEKAQGLDKDAQYQIEKRGEGTHKGVYDGEPNTGRMLMTRVLSTALGIGAYTITKRSAYATMGHFTGAKSFWGKAAIEGLATSTFFVMSTSNDVIEGLYNKLVAKPQEHKTPVQQDKHDELLARLNEKYKANGIAA